jgi:hypothetical protein
MVDAIVAALLGGLAASAGKVASAAVEDAYGALKGLLLRKLGQTGEAAEAIAKLEAKPDSDARKAVVAEELAAAKVADDSELVTAAQRLQAALDQLSAEARSQVQHAVGNYIAQASDGSTATVNVGRGGPAPKP